MLKRLYQDSRYLRTLYCRSFGRFRPSIIIEPPYSQSVSAEIWNTNDPVRYSFLAAALERLRQEGISGAMAELGVFRGETSRIIHRIAPERTLHLFDTFTGFSARDTDRTDFQGTGVELVKRNIGDMTNVKIHAGYFPETAIGLESERFALTILDADVYNPIAAGLEFFYPRTVPGGYIFVHDYNCATFNFDAKRATDTFLKDKPEQVIDMPDRWGTVAIRKHR